jgi:transposase
MRVSLSVHQRQELEALVADTREAKVLKRAQGLLAVADGESVPTIARRLQVCEKTVYNWVERWTSRETAAAECLADQPRSGRPTTLCDRVVETVTTLLETKPRDHGYRQAEWTVPLIQGHLAGEQIAASGTTIRQQLHKLGYRWKRPRFVLRRRSPTWKQAKGG